MQESKQLWLTLSEEFCQCYVLYHTQILTHTLIHTTHRYTTIHVKK